MNKELLRGVLDIILLAILFNKDMYGYEIAKKIKVLSNDCLSIGEGTLYPALKRLEKNSYVLSYWVSADNNLVKRKYYNITEKGILILNDKINDWQCINKLIHLCLKEGNA